jgi:hypothetical protein
MMDKFSYVIMFCSIHILACSWIFIGLIHECTWLKGGCKEGNTVFVPE